MSNAAIVETDISLADYTSESLLVPQLRESDPAGVIQELSQRLRASGHVPDLLPFYNAALNREYLVSTAMDHGMAFPHARLNGLKRVCFAVGRCATPIAWGSQAAKPVHLVFLLAVPATDATAYLYIVAALSRLGRDPGMIAALKKAVHSAEILAILRRIRLPHARGT